MIIDPIYLSSVIVSKFFNDSHLKRSLYYRLHEGGARVLRGPTSGGGRGYRRSAYRHTCPDVFQARPITPRRLISRNTAHCAYWNASASPGAAVPDLQRLHGVTGLAPSGEPSSLCKRGLMSRFARVSASLRDSPSAVNTGDLSAAGDLLNSDGPTCYRELKDCAREYSIARQDLHQAIEYSGIGKWLKKPTEVDMFCLDLHQ